MASNLAHCNCSHPPGSAEGLGMLDACGRYMPPVITSTLL